MSPLDTPIRVTIFPNHFGKRRQQHEMSLREFEEIFADTHRAAKAALPIIKLQTYGERRTEGGCLRNNENVLTVSGIEIDYDGDGQFAGVDKIGLQEAEEIFERANVAALIYPTWSHSLRTPSWRALCPCSAELEPPKRDALVARVNGLFGGRIDQHASFTLSQAMYFGRRGAASRGIALPGARLADGRFIDQCADLDRCALAKQTEVSGDKVRDESRSGRHYRACLESAAEGLLYDEHLESLDDAELLVYVNESRGETTKGEHDFEKACAKFEKQRAAVVEKFDDHSGDDEDDEPLKKKRRKRGLTFFARGAYDDLLPAFDFVPGTLQDYSTALVYGPPMSGKTFYTIHLLCSVALGRAVFGMKVEKRRALYIGLEGEAGIKTRIKAWCIHNDVDHSPIDYALGTFDILDNAQRDKLIAYMIEHGIEVVALDTLSKTMVGADENVAKEMSPIIDALHDIMARTKACVIAVTHTGKDVKAGIRGWSGQLGAADTTIEIIASTQRDEEPTLETPRIVRVRKQKDIERAIPVSFSLRAHATDIINARGEPVMSVAVSEDEVFRDVMPKEQKKMTEREKAALAILAQLRKHEALLGPPSRAELRTALKSAKWGPKNDSTWRTAFERLTDKLEWDSNDGLVRH